MCNMLDKRAFHVASLDDCLICRIQFPVQRQRTHIVKRDNNQQYQHQASDNHGSYKRLRLTSARNSAYRAPTYHFELHGIFA